MDVAEKENTERALLPSAELLGTFPGRGGVTLSPRSPLVRMLGVLRALDCPRAPRGQFQHHGWPLMAKGFSYLSLLSLLFSLWFRL